jgi:2',3'-cyclic-nucleotide 3'-phosphodiesterase
MQHGKYQFDASKRPAAHAYCRSIAQEACARRCHVIIIDNTNVCRREMKPYFDMAEQHNYVVVTVEPKTPWKFDPETLSKMNTHRVPEDAIRERLKVYHQESPLFWGWFLNSEDSNQLRKMAQSYFNAIAEMSDFQKHFASNGTKSFSSVHCQ